MFEMKERFDWPIHSSLLRRIILKAIALLALVVFIAPAWVGAGERLSLFLDRFPDGAPSIVADAAAVGLQWKRGNLLCRRILHWQRGDAHQ